MRRLVTYTTPSNFVPGGRPCWEVYDGKKLVAGVWYTSFGGGWFAFTEPDSRRFKELAPALVHAMRAPATVPGRRSK